MRYVGTAAVALLLSGVLVGCSDDTAPEGSPAPSASASTSATPSAPTLPAEAKGTGPAAAEAFVRHFVALINHAIATLDAEPMEQSSSGDCTSCNAIKRATSRLKAAGRSYEGGQWEVTGLRELSRRAEVRQIRAFVSIDELKVVEANGESKRVPAHETQFTFDIERNGEQWRVLQINGVAQ